MTRPPNKTSGCHNVIYGPAPLYLHKDPAALLAHGMRIETWRRIGSSAWEPRDTAAMRKLPSAKQSRQNQHRASAKSAQQQHNKNNIRKTYVLFSPSTGPTASGLGLCLQPLPAASAPQRLLSRLAARLCTQASALHPMPKTSKSAMT